MHNFINLFGLVLTGCRDAAFSKNSSLLQREIRLGWDLLDILRKPNALESRLEKAFVRYTKHASDSGDKNLLLRASVYSGLITSIQNFISMSETLENASSAMTIATLDAISNGLSEIELSLARGDFRRCEIEAEHIHNLPALLEPAALKSREYYMTTERKFYLDQLREHAGRVVEKEAASTFEKFWFLLED